MSNIVPPHNQHVVSIELATLRPTQITVGFSEVAIKRKQWGALKRKERAALLASHWFPSVLGPDGGYYVVDHHHLGLALLQEGVKRGFALVLRDLSYLAAARFWEVMEFYQWAHPYDTKGKRRSFADLPASLSDLQDDPYRSLAGLVRSAGGFAKDTTPFAEFLWASYFRERLDKRELATDLQSSIARGVAMARIADARYLPGWSGVARTTEIADTE